MVCGDSMGAKGKKLLSRGKFITYGIALALVVSLLLSTVNAQITVVVPNGSSELNIGSTENNTIFPAFQTDLRGSWLNLGALAVGVNVTSYVTDESIGSGYYDILNINLAGLISVNETYGYVPSLIQLGAFMNQSINEYNISNLEIAPQLVGSYAGTGVNITNPQSIAIPASYEYTAEMVAAGLDIATGTVYPGLAVSTFFFFYNQYAANYDSSWSSSGSRYYGTAKFYQSYDVKSQPYLATRYSALAETNIEWSIPYSEIDNGQSYALTLYAAAYYPNEAQWNYSYAYVSVVDQTSGGGGGCVAWGSPILTPDGYVPVQKLKPGDRVEEYGIQNGTMFVGTILYNNKTESSSVVSVNNGTLLLTPTDQPVFIRNSTYIGWLRDPQNLSVGDQLFDPVNDTWINVTSVNIIYEHIKVFDVVTSGANDFIDNGILLDKKAP